MVSVSTKEIIWVVIWMIESFFWCYSSPGFYTNPITFLLSVHLAFGILYVRTLETRFGGKIVII